jgi:hypothetical protein
MPVLVLSSSDELEPEPELSDVLVDVEGVGLADE